MMDNKCKKCRRAGEKLFLKGEKCFTPKCPVSRKPYPPGVSPRAKSRKRTRRSALSEYAAQLRERQKIKFSYGIRRKQFDNYLEKSTKKIKKGDTKAYLFEILESRLDNVVFRLGLAGSRSIAKQVVTHGHIMVNNKRINVPSYKVRMGDKISIRPQSFKKGVFKDLDIKMKKYTPPPWVEFDKAKNEGVIKNIPSALSA